MLLLRSKDFLAGLFILAVGALGLAIGRNYETGTPSEMGPGYFPLILSIILVVLGLVQIIGAMRETEREEIDPIQWRVLVLPTLGIVVFALLLERAGLVISLAMLLGISMLASRETRYREIPILILCAIVFCYVVFIYGVGLPMKVWP
ncbi:MULTISPECIES: tripartite tricarboxylate transporter TctB family protein [unclassified Chelatococcus]|uniref:tripartite tricarboxylate transporter TctB family protein n=1 Tax=unclassified Chelatococcus TaxID=2638111 RepID=UPI001BD1AD46|nr:MULTISPECIES: tripartite tricarboxylate transporter TctB family protein [unclassified Chelatococcus]MBS7699955.1 tripartite tricarboxylate transporter TctB family protein [Chelatococcus sp. YT9]MBX3558620.1 tripartite tricarboxylate transporter TctB family protein [Chelatococcus sp.]